MSAVKFAPHPNEQRINIKLSMHFNGNDHVTAKKIYTYQQVKTVTYKKQNESYIQFRNYFDFLCIYCIANDICERSWLFSKYVHLDTLTMNKRDNTYKNIKKAGQGKCLNE